MQKYREDLIEQVRSGKAQVQVDNDSQWDDLVKYIFPKKNYDGLSFNYYYGGDFIKGFNQADSPTSNIPIIHAKYFIIQEPEVKWVEVRNNVNCQWVRAILIADIGTQFKFRYITVESDQENKFIGGESNLDISGFKFMREIPQPEPLTHSELEKLIGKPFKYVAE